jgi:hypothetical protein
MRPSEILSGSSPGREGLGGGHHQSVDDTNMRRFSYEAVSADKSVYLLDAQSNQDHVGQPTFVRHIADRKSSTIGGKEGFVTHTTGPGTSDHHMLDQDGYVTAASNSYVKPMHSPAVLRSKAKHAMHSHHVSQEGLPYIPDNKLNR